MKLFALHGVLLCVLVPCCVSAYEYTLNPKSLNDIVWVIDPSGEYSQAHNQGVRSAVVVYVREGRLFTIGLAELGVSNEGLLMSGSGRGTVGGNDFFYIRSSASLDDGRKLKVDMKVERANLLKSVNYTVDDVTVFSATWVENNGWSVRRPSGQ